MQHSPPHRKVEVALLDLNCKQGRGRHSQAELPSTADSEVQRSLLRQMQASWQRSSANRSPGAPAQSTQTRLMLFWKGVPAVLHAKLFFLVSAVIIGQGILQRWPARRCRSKAELDKRGAP